MLDKCCVYYVGSVWKGLDKGGFYVDISHQTLDRYRIYLGL